MENTSPFLAMQRVEQQVKLLVRQTDTDAFSMNERKELFALRRLAIDTRLDVRDYELSETRPEQLQNMQEAKKGLAQLEKGILAASAVFGPADVAQLSAQITQISSWLE
jgi:hypothetical protein